MFANSANPKPRGARQLKEKRNAANLEFTAFPASRGWALRDLNPGPPGYEPDALTN